MMARDHILSTSEQQYNQLTGRSTSLNDIIVIEQLHNQQEHYAIELILAYTQPLATIHTLQLHIHRYANNAPLLDLDYDAYSCGITNTIMHFDWCKVGHKINTSLHNDVITVSNSSILATSSGIVNDDYDIVFNDL